MMAACCVQILVFSTWSDVLDLLSDSLHASSIPFCYGNTGAKLKGSLDSFKGDSEKQVLLLLLKRAGVVHDSSQHLNDC